MPDDNNLPFGLIGVGDTAQAAEEDFSSSYRGMLEFLATEGVAFSEELEFVFEFDLSKTI